MAAQYAEIDAVLAREGIPAAVECESRLWVDGPRRTPDQVDASVRERVRVMNTAISLQPEEVGTRERLDPPAITRLGEITAPTLVVVGDGDVPDVIATADLLASRIAGARKVILPDVAHMLTMERPDTFNRLVLDFLDEQYH
jgi:3-oxoadipate enol-lactonase